MIHSSMVTVDYQFAIVLSTSTHIYISLDMLDYDHFVMVRILVAWEGGAILY
jgi:hypothetical protein